jgi:hypothetical protein
MFKQRQKCHCAQPADLCACKDTTVFILNLGIRQSCQLHAPTALAPRKPAFEPTELKHGCYLCQGQPNVRNVSASYSSSDTANFLSQGRHDRLNV